jgi:hypothetical protein
MVTWVCPFSHRLHFGLITVCVQAKRKTLSNVSDSAPLNSVSNDYISCESG